MKTTNQANISASKQSNEALFDEFFEEKQALESTLATLELLGDEKALSELNQSIDEINKGQSKKVSFDEIDKNIFYIYSEI